MQWIINFIISNEPKQLVDTNQNNNGELYLTNKKQ